MKIKLAVITIILMMVMLTGCVPPCGRTSRSAKDCPWQERDHPTAAQCADAAQHGWFMAGCPEKK